MFGRALVMDPDYIQAAMALVDLLCANSDYSECIELLEQVRVNICVFARLRVYVYVYVPQFALCHTPPPHHPTTHPPTHPPAGRACVSTTRTFYTRS